MKDKIKKLCVSILTVILSVICAGCGDLTAVKTKYCAQLDEYYAEIQAMDLEYSTIFIQAELAKGKEIINTRTTREKALTAFRDAKENMQAFVLSQDELAILKQVKEDKVLYYLGKTPNSNHQLFVFDIVSLLAWDGIQNIKSYQFTMPVREIFVFDGEEFYILTYAYVKEFIDLEDLAYIHEKYTVIASQTPNVFVTRDLSE